MLAPPSSVPSTAFGPLQDARPARADASRGANETAAVQPPARAADVSAAKSAPPEIDKRSRELSPQQLAENEFRTGTSLLHAGRAAEAQERFRAALQHNPAHVAATQALFGVLLHAKNLAEAEQVLRDALKLNARQPGFAMALARLQIERGDNGGAVETLQRSAPAASGNPDYFAFLAALLQRQERHAEAVQHYQAALSLAPNSAVWNMGLGISLQALNRNTDAQDAFRRAKASNALNADLQAFVDDRLRQLQR